MPGTVDQANRSTPASRALINASIPRPSVERISGEHLIDKVKAPMPVPSSPPIGQPRGSWRLGFALAWACCLASPLTAQVVTPEMLEAARNHLVDDVLEPAGITSPRVLEAIRSTDRHELIPQRLWNEAYVDSSLPIGEQQTISSPFIVASMTQILDPQPTDKVLEIGTGSGYQAAVLSPLVDHVYTIEIVERLGRKAEQDLKRLGYDNISVRVGDGFLGWPEAAPFDKIIVTCSPESVPQPLVDQLREGGTMVIPVGERYQQTLYLMRKVDGQLEQTKLEPTLFVPMTGQAEQQRQQLPDPARPRLINGDFEATGDRADDVPGWYYGRQVEQVAGDAAKGNGFVRFRNDTLGRDSHLMQGLALDGRKVKRIRLTAQVRMDGVVPGPEQFDKPVVALTFYDAERRELGTQVLGPYRGTMRWTGQAREIRVPVDTREAIVRIGLFGATGTADFDEVSLTPR